MHNWSGSELWADWLTICHFSDEADHQCILSLEQRTSSSEIPRGRWIKRREVRDGHTIVQGSYQSLEKLSREKAVGEVDRVGSSGESDVFGGRRRSLYHENPEGRCHID